jgi:hypothetical protein
VILAKLGYLILLPEEIESISDLASMRPLVRCSTNGSYAEIPDDGTGSRSCSSRAATAPPVPMRGSRGR